MKASCVVDWNNHLREVCAAQILANPRVIGGPNMTVEIDESMFTNRKNYVGRQLPQQWILRSICRETKECFMVIISDRSATTLLPIIEDNIRPCVAIISDGWSPYENIINIGHFQHLNVNHSLHYINPTNGVHTPNIERHWKSAKEKKRQKWHSRRSTGFIIYVRVYMATRDWIKRVGLDPFDSILQHIVDFWLPQ
uniref:ISXO2-like transposase domain-containing protein n=1 Tax=Octopus bimaculoides TaxID=37653 RepID=A0A0L8HEP7_OCTBM